MPLKCYKPPPSLPALPQSSLTTSPATSLPHYQPCHIPPSLPALPHPSYTSPATPLPHYQPCHIPPSLPDLSHLSLTTSPATPLLY